MGNSFPLQGEYCPICKDRAEKFHKYQEQWVNKGDALLKKALANNLDISTGYHSNIRKVERCFSKKDIVAAIEAGYVIERQKHHHGGIVWLINSNIKITQKKYRPIHIAVSFQEDYIKVITIYDPRTHAWKWNKNYSRRLCWCQNKKKEE